MKKQMHSDHFDGVRFFNPQGNNPKTLKHVLKWQLQKDVGPWPDFFENKRKAQVPLTVSDKEMAVTFINHESFLLQFHNLNILTDPVFSERVSPFQWIGPRRVHPPGLKIEELPPIHLILVSHNHYDHMDSDSLFQLAEKFKPQIVVPMGNKKYFHKSHQSLVTELDWHESAKILGIEVHVQPAYHWSRRKWNDMNQSLWGSFVLKASWGPIYFAGDTGYNDHFRKTKEKYGPMKLSFLPIGAYEPRWFMKESHMNPAEAVQAHLDLNSELSIPMHYGTFRLTDEAFNQPLIDLREALQKNPEVRFRPMEIAETLKLTPASLKIENSVGI